MPAGPAALGKGHAYKVPLYPNITQHTGLATLTDWGNDSRTEGKLKTSLERTWEDVFRTSKQGEISIDTYATHTHIYTLHMYTYT